MNQILEIKSVNGILMPKDKDNRPAFEQIKKSAGIFRAVEKDLDLLMKTGSLSGVSVVLVDF